MTTAHINHQDRDHALLSASGASRWLGCTPSARLEEQYGEPDKESPYAKEGTLAHELAELYLKKDLLNNISEEDFDAQLESIMDNELFNEEMLDMVPVYTDYCKAQFEEAKTKTPDAIALIEQKVDLTKWVPESFGTTDFTLIAEPILEIVDFKYGKGVPVSATANKQEMLYALGTLAKYDMLYDIKTVRLTIVQPRLDNISSWDISVEDLYKWAETEVKPKADLAFKGEGELTSGEWCRFCKVKNRCRALAEENLKMAKYEFKEPRLLSEKEVSNILTQAPKLIDWANSVLAYAQEQAINGKQWPGYKLVEGRSIRKWTSEEEVESILLANDFNEDEIFTMKLKGITDIQKLLGKSRFEALLGKAVIKPQGKPTLVPESDKRPALGIEGAKADFAEELL